MVGGKKIQEQKIGKNIWPNVSFFDNFQVEKHLHPSFQLERTCNNVFPVNLKILIFFNSFAKSDPLQHGWSPVLESRYVLAAFVH